MFYYLIEIMFDIFVVVASWLEFLSEEDHPFATRLTAVRALRLLEPLSRIKIIYLRTILITIYISVTDMAGVAGMLAILQFIFGCISTQLWRGLLKGQCAFTDPSLGQQIIPGAAPIDHPVGSWFQKPQSCALPKSVCDFPRFDCSVSNGDACPMLFAPISNASLISLQQVCVQGDAPDFGQTNFDNVFASMLNAFFASMQQGWSTTMIAVGKTKGYREAVFLFFAVHVIISGFVLLPLFLSVLTANFYKASKWDNEHLERLANAAFTRLRPNAAMSAIFKKFEFREPTGAMKNDAIDGALFPDSPGPFHRRRRLDSLVNLEGFEATILLIERDLNSRLTTLESPMEDMESSLKSRDNSPVENLSSSSAYVLSAAAVQREQSQSRWSWQRQLETYTESPAWCHLVNFLLFCNAVVWSLPYSGMPSFYARTLFIADAVFGVLSFALSLGWALGHKNTDFARKLWMIVDFACTLCGFLEILLSPSDGSFLEGGSSFLVPGATSEMQLRKAVDALHIVRVIRVVLLISAWFEGRRLLRRLILAGPMALGALSLFCFYILFFSLWGRQLFGSMYSDGSTLFPNFRSIQMGVIASFEFSDGENTDQVLKAHVAAMGWQSALFFILMTCVGSFVVLNLFIAALVESSIITHTREEESALGYEVPSETKLDSFSQPLRGFLKFLAFISPIAPDQIQISLQRKTSLTLKTGALGAAESVSVSILPSNDSEKPVHIKVTASSITTITDGDVYTGREWSFKRMKKWLSTIFGLLPSKEGAIDPISSPLKGSPPPSPSRRFVKLPAVLVDAPPPAPPLEKSPRATLRGVARSLNSSPLWILLSIVAIVWSSVNLAFEVPRLDFCGDADALALRGISQPFSCRFLQYFHAADLILAIFFVFELLLNVAARGLHPFVPGSFFVTYAGALDWWTMLDIAVVSGAIGGVINFYFNLHGGWIRTFRAGRALRSLRILERFSSLRTTASSLLRSTMRSKDPIILALLLCAATAFSGMRLYGGGGTSYCTSDSLPLRLGSIIVPKTNRSECGLTAVSVVGDACVLLPTVQDELKCRASATGASVTPIWSPYIFNFDDFGSALLSAYELLSGQNWVSYLKQYMSAADEQRGTTMPNTSLSVPAFFIIAEIVLQHFSVGLFGGFIARTYFADRTLTLGLGMLSPEQRVWVQNLQAALEVRAPWALRAPKSSNAALGSIRAFVFSTLHHPRCEALTSLLISLNMVVLAAASVTQTPSTATTLSIVADFFTAIFVIELALRIFGTGLTQFARNPWDLIDAGVTIFSVFGLLLSTASGDIGRTIYVLSRLVRILRVFRLARYFPGLRRMLDLLAKASSPVGNVILIHTLIVYVYAIIGMSLFEGVRYGRLGAMDPISVNFDTFTSSFVSLWQLTTGENLLMMHELMPHPPFCIKSLGNCGSGWYSVTFFVSFFILTRFLVLSLVSTIMMHILTNVGFVDLTTGMIRLSYDMKESFAVEWGKLDPDATHIITRSHLLLLLTRLPPPLGFAREDDYSVNKELVPPSLAARSQARRLLESLHLPACGSIDLSASTTMPQGSFLVSSMLGRMSLSRRHAASVMPSPPPSSPPISSSDTSNNSSYGFMMPKSTPLTGSLSPSAQSPSIRPSDLFGAAEEPHFHFHTVLSTLIAHHNSTLLRPPKIEMKGKHESGQVTLAAMMIMKRAFARFRMRRAAILALDSSGVHAPTRAVMASETPPRRRSDRTTIRVFDDSTGNIL